MSIEGVRQVRSDFVADFWRFLNESAGNNVTMPEILGWFVDGTSFEKAREETLEGANKDFQGKVKEQGWFWVVVRKDEERSYTFFVDNGRPRSYWATFYAILDIHFAETFRQGGGTKIPNTSPRYM
jgi:hypothetical protein